MTRRILQRCELRSHPAFGGVNSVAIVSLIFLLVGCTDTGQGPLDPIVRPPFLQKLTLSPDSVNVDALTPSGGQYTITSTITVRATDPEGAGDIKSVSYSILLKNSVIQTGALSSQSAGSDSVRVFTAQFSFGLDRSGTGSYQVEVSAVDNAGSKSNILTTRLLVAKKNTPPQLSGAGIRPVATADSVKLTTSIAVFDSNGYQSISSVTIRPNNTTDPAPRLMYDDGAPEHGDRAAGDGIFSAVLTVKPTGAVEGIECEFRAKDNTGAESDPLRKGITNRAPAINSLDVPSTIERPVSGLAYYTFKLTASDPDGKSDIDSVYFRNQSSSTPSNFLMYDDGNLSTNGDLIAGDGIYSRIVVIDQTASTGAKSFLFRVVDFGGARADSVKVITIQ